MLSLFLFINRKKRIDCKVHQTQNRQNQNEEAGNEEKALHKPISRLLINLINLAILLSSGPRRLSLLLEDLEKNLEREENERIRRGEEGGKPGFWKMVFWCRRGNIPVGGSNVKPMVPSFCSTQYLFNGSYFFGINPTPSHPASTTFWCETYGVLQETSKQWCLIEFWSIHSFNDVLNLFCHPSFYCILLMTIVIIWCFFYIFHFKPLQSFIDTMCHMILVSV